MKPGEKIGEWIVEELLGEGAFGRVFKARAAADPARRAALKVPRDERGAALLAREGAVQSKLQAPCFPRVLGVSARPAYIAFEYVEGPSLREVLGARRLPVREAATLARAVLDALERAHKAGVVHRDLKPENVLLAGDRVLVTDFGLALHEPDAMAHSLDEEDAAPIAGSLPYLAPEVREGKVADERSDLYAWGVLLHELLTGALPSAAEAPSAQAPEAKPLDEVFKKACAARERRYPSAADAIAELDRVIAKLAAPKPTSKVDVAALLDRVGREETTLLGREFTAYVTPEGKATARVAGKTYTFDVRAEWPGMAVLKAISPTEAIVVRRPGK